VVEMEEKRKKRNVHQLGLLFRGVSKSQIAIELTIFFLMNF
jgi:hypothetical protein